MRYLRKSARFANDISIGRTIEKPADHSEAKHRHMTAFFPSKQHTASEKKTIFLNLKPPRRKNPHWFDCSRMFTCWRELVSRTERKAGVTRRDHEKLHQRILGKFVYDQYLIYIFVWRLKPIHITLLQWVYQYTINSKPPNEDYLKYIQGRWFKVICNTVVTTTSNPVLQMTYIGIIRPDGS